MISPQATEAGIKNLLFDYFSLESSASLLLLAPLDQWNLCESVAEIARSYGHPCITLPSNTTFKQVEKLINKHNVIAYFEKTESTHSKELLHYLKTHMGSHQQFFRVFDFSNELFSEAFRVPQAQLLELNEAIIAKGRCSSIVTVRSDLGTDLQIRLEEKYGWINSCGLFRNSKPGVLPPSEVATYSNAVNGVIYADGAINTNFGFPIDPRLAEHPVRVEIENSQVVSVYCEHKIINHLLQKFFQIENAKRVGEVGFGTNIGLTQFVPFLSHINERFPSLHLGFGANNQGAPLVMWKCPMHLDLILDCCEVFFDDELILSNRDYKVSKADASFDLEKVPMAYADTV